MPLAPQHQQSFISLQQRHAVADQTGSAEKVSGSISGRRFHRDIREELFMKITARNVKTAVTDYGRVSISFECSRNAISTIERLKAGNYELTIDKPTRKRTGSQNNYLWELLGQISLKENGNREDDENIYCQLIEKVGAKCEYLMGKPETKKALESTFRVVKVVDDRFYGDVYMHVFKCYYGSSKMDTKEMAVLIDAAIERAEAAGIDTEYYKLKLLGV